jgi:hypothetical protein
MLKELEMFKNLSNDEIVLVTEIVERVRSFEIPFSDQNGRWLNDKMKVVDPRIVLMTWHVLSNAGNVPRTFEVHKFMCNVLFERCYGMKTGETGMNMIPDLSIVNELFGSNIFITSATGSGSS